MKKKGDLYSLDTATYLVFCCVILGLICLGIFVNMIYGAAQRSCFNASGLQDFRYLCEGVFPLAVSFFVSIIGLFLFAIAIGYFPICGCEK